MAAVFDAPWRLTRSAQFKLGVTVDGIWGEKTDAAFHAASPSLRESVRKDLEREKLSVYSVIRVTRTVKEPATKPLPATTPILGQTLPPSGTNDLISPAEAEMMAAKAEIQFGLPAGTLIEMLRLEAPRVIRGKEILYAPGRRGGLNNRYVGLYQFFDREQNGAGLPFAWGIARNFARKRGVDLPSIQRWADAQTNTLAAAAYADYHKQQLALKGVKASPALLYFAHQQGLGTVRESLAAGKPSIVGKQSTASISYIMSAFT